MIRSHQLRPQTAHLAILQKELKLNIQIDVIYKAVQTNKKARYSLQFHISVVNFSYFNIGKAHSFNFKYKYKYY